MDEICDCCGESCKGSNTENRSLHFCSSCYEIMLGLFSYDFLMESRDTETE